LKTTIESNLLDGFCRAGNNVYPTESILLYCSVCVDEENNYF